MAWSLALRHLVRGGRRLGGCPGATLRTPAGFDLEKKQTGAEANHATHGSEPQDHRNHPSEIEWAWHAPPIGERQPRVGVRYPERRDMPCFVHPALAMLENARLAFAWMVNADPGL